jgi:WD40 repeat protein
MREKAQPTLGLKTQARSTERLNTSFRENRPYTSQQSSFNSHRGSKGAALKHAGRVVVHKLFGGKTDPYGIYGRLTADPKTDPKGRGLKPSYTDRQRLIRNLLPMAISSLMLVPPSSCMGCTRNELRTFQQGKSPILVARFTSDGSHLISASTDGKVVMWDVKTGQRLWQISLDSQSTASRESTVSHITDMDLSSDGRTLALSYWRDHIVGDRLASRDEGRIALLDARTGQETKVLTRDQTKPRALAFSPDNYLLASAGGDKTARFCKARFCRER